MPTSTPPPSPAAPRPAHPWLWLGGLFVLALGLRAANVAALDATPLARLLLGDAGSYDAWARQILAGDFLSRAQGVFYQAPGYPYFLAFTYALLGASPLSALAVQTLLGAMACLLLVLAGRAFFNWRVGLVAGFALACFPPAIYFDGLVQKAALAGFLMCALLAALGWGWRGGRAGAWLTAGILLGLLTLTSENALLLVGVVLLWQLLGLQALSRKRRVVAALALLLGLALTLAPVSLRNQVVGGEWHLTTSQFGPNLWLGNHPGADGFYQPMAPGRGNWHFERADAQRLADAASGRHLSPSEVSAYWAGRVLDYIRTQPGAWLRLTMRKTWLFWNMREIGDTASQYLEAEQSPVLAVLGWLWHFGLLVPLAVAGVVVTWGRRKKLWLLYLLIAAFAASVIPFIIYDRYRFPVVPPLALFAAAALVAAWEGRRQFAWRALAWPLGLALPAALLVNWPAESTSTLRASASFNVAVNLEETGDEGAARHYYEHTLALNPAHDGAHVNLGQLDERAGKFQAALDHYQAAVDGNPGAAEARTDLAAMLVRADRLAEAVKHGREAVRLDPSLPEAQYNLGLALLRQGFPGEAADHFAHATELRPTWATAFDELGTARLHQNRPAEAIAAYQRALALRPDFAAARQNLAGAYHATGDDEAAIAQYNQALVLSPNQPTMHLNLAIVLLAQGKSDDAIAHMRTAVQLAPANVDAHRALGYALGKAQQYDDAAREYEAVLKLTPNDADALRALGLLDRLRERK